MADIILDVGGDLRPLEKEIRRVSRKGINPLNEKGFTQPLGRITGQLGEFEKALEASNARVLAFGASAGALVAFQKALSAIVDSSINVEKKLADINVILNASSKNLDKFSTSLFAVARNTASSFNDVADAATELARQGLTVEQTLKRTQDALILTRLSGLKAAESVEAITAALNSFSAAAIDSSTFVSKLAAVDAAFAVSSKDLAEAVKRVGSSAIEAGLGIDELIAAVTSAQQITARGGAVIGNSFKTIFTRIQRPRVIKELENLGIAVKGIGGTVKPAMQILQELAKTYDTLSATQRAATAELIGGVFQVNVLKASLRDLSKEYSLYGNALAISNAATDEAARRNEELNKTLGATLNQTVANLTNFGSKVGQLTFGPAIKKVLGGINSAIADFDLKDPDSLGEKIGAGVLGGLGKFLSGPGLLVIGVTLIKTFTRLASQVTDAFKTITNIGKQGEAQFKAQQKVAEILSKEPALLSKIESGTLSLAQAHREVLFLIEKENDASRDFLNTAKKVAAINISPFSGKSATPPTLSRGHIPNFSNKDKAAKRKELASASYANSSTRAVKDKMPGIGTYYRNTAEKKITGKQFGLKQDFIVPPKGSQEGNAYRKRTSRMGIDVDNLAYRGYVPNFAETATKIKLPMTTLGTDQGKFKKIISKYYPESVLTPTGGGEEIGSLPKTVDGIESKNKGKDFRLGGERLISLNNVDFNSIAENQYKDSIKRMAVDSFGADLKNFSIPSFDKTGWPQTKGRMFEEMIQGLGGGAGAGQAGVDLGKGLSNIASMQGEGFIKKYFKGTEGLDISRPIEVRGSRAAAKDAKLSHKAVQDMLFANPKFPMGANTHHQGINYLATEYATGKDEINLSALARIKEKSKGVNPAIITQEQLDSLKSSGVVPNFAPVLQASKTYGPWQSKRLHEGKTKIGVDPKRFKKGLYDSTDGWGMKKKGVHDRIKTKLNVFTHGEPGTLKQLQQDPMAYETDPEIQKFLSKRGLSSVDAAAKKGGFVKGGKKQGGLGIAPGYTPVDYMEFTSEDGREKVENFARGGEVSLKSAYDKRGFENRPAREVVRKSLEHMFRGSPKNYKQGKQDGIQTEVDYVMHPDNLKDFLATMSGGFFPNFATGLFDSDRLPSGVNRNSIVDAIVASGKPMHVFHGPAGAGKTTAAMSRYPGAELVTSLEQIAALNDFAVVSGTNRSKKSGEYSARAQAILNAASKITAVIPARSDLMSRRFGRAAKGPAAGDKRDHKGIEGTLRAPGTDYRLYADLKKQGKNVEVLRNEGFVPNFKKGDGKKFKAVAKAGDVTKKSIGLGSAVAADLSGAGGVATLSWLGGELWDWVSKTLNKKGDEAPANAKAETVLRAYLGKHGGTGGIGPELGDLTEIRKKGYGKLTAKHVKEKEESYREYFNSPAFNALQGAASAGMNRASTIKGGVSYSNPEEHGWVAKTYAGKVTYWPPRATNMDGSLSKRPNREVHNDYLQNTKFEDAGDYRKKISDQSFIQALFPGEFAFLGKDKQTQLGTFSDSSVGQIARLGNMFELQEKSKYPYAKSERTKAFSVKPVVSSGLVPNFLNKKSNLIHQAGLLENEKQIKSPEGAGQLTYSTVGDSNILEFNSSNQKGAGFKQFQELVRHSRKQNKSILSGALDMQGGFGSAEEIKKFPTNFKALGSKYYFPQLRHRLIDGLQTSGNYFHESGAGEAVSFNFNSIKDLRSRVNNEDRDSYSEILSDPRLGVYIERLVSSHVKGKGDGAIKFSKGFVPNFANPLREAIAREAGAVPKSAIRIGQSSSLKSDGNPMGLGVYNTRDEPNGLNQGIQRARKEKRNPKTYGAAKGFLPNFAPEEEASVDVRFGLEGLADEVKAELITALDKVRHAYEIEAEDREELSAATENLAREHGVTGAQLDKFKTGITNQVKSGKQLAEAQKTVVGQLKKGGKAFLSSFTQSDSSSEWEGRMLSLSFAIPQVTETFKQFAGESNKTFTAATDAVSGFASTYTGVTSLLPGPAGKVTAGLVSAYTALQGFAKQMQNDSEAMAKEVDKSKEAFQQLSNNLTAYASALSEYEQAAGDPNTTAQTLLTLENKLQDYMASIPSEFAMQIAGVGDPADLESKIAEILKKQSQQQVQAEIGLNLTADLDKVEGIITGFVDIIGGNSRNLKEIFSGAEGEISLQRVVADMRKGIDFKGLANDTANARKNLNLESASRNQFISILGAQYDATTQLQTVLRDLSNSDFRQFRESLMESARAAEEQAAAQRAVAEFREKEADRLGMADQRDAQDRYKANLDSERAAMSRMGGGVAGLLDPAGTLGPLSEQLLRGATNLASGARGPAGTVQRGKGALELADAQFGFGTFIPELDVNTGKLNEEGSKLQERYINAFEVNFRTFAQKRIEALQNRRQLAIKQGGDVSALDDAIQREQRSIGVAPGMDKDDIENQRNLLRRSGKQQFQDRYGIKELAPTQFRVGAAAGPQEIPGQTIGMALEGKGIVGKKQQALIKRAYERKFEEELDQFDDAIASATERLGETQPDTDARKEAEQALQSLQNRKDAIEEGLTRFRSTGLQTGMQELRNLGAKGIDVTDPTQAGRNFLAGRGAEVSVTGQEETPAEKALRIQMENLEATEKALTDAVKQRVEQENEKIRERAEKRQQTTLAGAIQGGEDAAAIGMSQVNALDIFNPFSDGINEAFDAAGSRAAILEEQIKKHGVSDVTGGGGGFGEVGDLGRLALRGITGGRSGRVSAMAEAQKESTSQAFQDLAKIMPDLITTASLGTASDLEGVTTAELKAAIAEFNKQNTGDGDIEGESRELLLRMGKNMLSTFGEKGAEKSTKFLSNLYDQGQEATRGAQERTDYLSTIAGWSGSPAAQTILWADKIGLVDAIKGGGKEMAAEMRELKNKYENAGSTAEKQQIESQFERKYESATKDAISKGKGSGITSGGMAAAGFGLTAGIAGLGYGAKKVGGLARYGTIGGIGQASSTSVNRTRDLARGTRIFTGAKVDDAAEGMRRIEKVFAENADAFGIKGPRSVGAIKAELGDDAFKELTRAIGRQSGKSGAFGRFDTKGERAAAKSLVDEALAKAEKATTKGGKTGDIEKSVQKGAEKGAEKGTSKGVEKSASRRVTMSGSQARLMGVTEPPTSSSVNKVTSSVSKTTSAPQRLFGEQARAALDRQMGVMRISRGGRELAQPGRLQRLGQGFNNARAGLNSFNQRSGSVMANLRGTAGAGRYVANQFATNTGISRLRGAGQMVRGLGQGLGGLGAGVGGRAALELGSRAANLGGRGAINLAGRLAGGYAPTDVAGQNLARQIQRGGNAARGFGAGVSNLQSRFADSAARFTGRGFANVGSGFNEMVGGQGSRIAAARDAANKAFGSSFLKSGGPSSSAMAKYQAMREKALRNTKMSGGGSFKPNMQGISLRSNFTTAGRDIVSGLTSRAGMGTTAASALTKSMAQSAQAGTGGFLGNRAAANAGQLSRGGLSLIQQGNKMGRFGKALRLDKLATRAGAGLGNIAARGGAAATGLAGLGRAGGVALKGLGPLGMAVMMRQGMDESATMAGYGLDGGTSGILKGGITAAMTGSMQTGSQAARFLGAEAGGTMDDFGALMTAGGMGALSGSMGAGPLGAIAGAAAGMYLEVEKYKNLDDQALVDMIANMDSMTGAARANANAMGGVVDNLVKLSSSQQGAALGFKQIDQATADAFKSAQKLGVNFQSIGDNITTLQSPEVKQYQREGALNNIFTSLGAPLRAALEGIAGKSAADMTETEIALLAGTGVKSDQVRAAQGDREAMTALVDQIRSQIKTEMSSEDTRQEARDRIGSLRNITSQRGQQAEDTIKAALSSNTQGTKIEDINFADVSKFLQATGQLARNEAISNNAAAQAQQAKEQKTLFSDAVKKGTIDADIATYGKKFGAQFGGQMMQARTGISDSTTEIKRLEQIKSKKGLTTQQEEQLVEAKKKRDESLSQQSRLLGSVEDSNILQLGSIMGVKLTEAQQTAVDVAKSNIQKDLSKRQDISKQLQEGIEAGILTKTGKDEYGTAIVGTSAAAARDYLSARATGMSLEEIKEQGLENLNPGANKEIRAQNVQMAREGGNFVDTMYQEGATIDTLMEAINTPGKELAKDQEILAQARKDYMEKVKEETGFVSQASLDKQATDIASRGNKIKDVDSRIANLQQAGPIPEGAFEREERERKLANAQAEKAELENQQSEAKTKLAQDSARRGGFKQYGFEAMKTAKGIQDANAEMQRMVDLGVFASADSSAKSEMDSEVMNQTIRDADKIKIAQELQSGKDFVSGRVLSEDEKQQRKLKLAQIEAEQRQSDAIFGKSPEERKAFEEQRKSQYRQAQMAQAVQKYQGMSKEEREEYEGTQEGRYVASYIERQKLLGQQQKNIAAAQRNPGMMAKQHAIAGTQGYDFRRGLTTEQFDAAAGRIDEEAAKRIAQRRDMLSSGEYGGRKLTEQQRQQVAAAQQRDVASLYGRTDEDGTKFNEIMRQAIIEGMKQAVAESSPQAPQNQTNPAQPAMNPDGTPVQPGQQPGQGTTEVASNVKLDVNPMTINFTGDFKSDVATFKAVINEYLAEVAGGVVASAVSPAAAFMAALYDKAKAPSEKPKV